jgi:hypothetical protein
MPGQLPGRLAHPSRRRAHDGPDNPGTTAAPQTAPSMPGHEQRGAAGGNFNTTPPPPRMPPVERKEGGAMVSRRGDGSVVAGSA